MCIYLNFQKSWMLYWEHRFRPYLCLLETMLLCAIVLSGLWWTTAVLEVFETQNLKYFNWNYIVIHQLASWNSLHLKPHQTIHHQDYAEFHQNLIHWNCVFDLDSCHRTNGNLFVWKIFKILGASNLTIHLALPSWGVSLGWRKIKKAARLAPENVGRYQISWLQGIHLNTDNVQSTWEGILGWREKIDISETENNVFHFKYWIFNIHHSSWQLNIKIFYNTTCELHHKTFYNFGI